MASDTLEGRLRDAIDEWGSVRGFSQEMAKRNAPGHTRSMIHRYLRPDGPRPSREFLGAAAEVLGVSYEWLRDGPPDADTELLALRRWKGEWDRVRHAGVEAGAPGLAEVAFAKPRIERAIAVLTLWHEDTGPDHPIPFGIEELARRVARAIAAPAEAFGLDLVEMAAESPRLAEVYIAGIETALQALALYAGPIGYVDVGTDRDQEEPDGDA